MSHQQRTCLVVAVWFCLPPSSFGQSPRRLLPPPGVAEVKALEQNWSDSEAEWFYNVPQGSKLIPYKWFLHLEQPDKETLFRDAEHIRSLGYLPRSAGGGNAHGLPVGFVKDGLHLGLTCAACHTTQIVYKDKAWVIDGAPTLGDFETLLRRLAASLKATVDDCAKFKRFAANVLGAGATDDDRDALRKELEESLAFRQGYNARNLPRGGSRFGPGRVDAFGAIMNEVSSTFAQLPTNHAPADAPVSYPFLWDTPHHDRVQWNGAAPNETSLAGIPIVGTKHVGALGRNAGEVMGVFGNIRVVKDGFLIPGRYASTVNMPHLIDIEESVRGLWSPQWPKEFPAIDADKRNKGEELFQRHCVECHQPITRDDPQRTITAWLKSSVGTDPTMARNFLVRKGRTGAFQDQRVNLLRLRRFGADAAVAEMLQHAVQRVLVGGSGGVGAPLRFDLAAVVEVDLGASKLVGRFQSVELDQDRFVAGLIADERNLKDLLIQRGGKALKFDLKKLAAGQFLLDDGGLKVEELSLDSVISAAGSLIGLKKPAPVSYVYKARPLNGIWATAPYLHNGSVPNLDELLKKPEKRVQRFRVGSLEFDPIKVGFRSDVGDFELDATQPGNRNIGHDYDVEFTPDQRLELIEYMKSL